jgi:tetratricopeptide (TPR) repeat protein
MMAPYSERKKQLAGIEDPVVIRKILAHLSETATQTGSVPLLSGKRSFTSNDFQRHLSRPDIVISIHFQRYSLQLTGTVRGVEHALARVSPVLLNSDMPQAAIDQLSEALRLNPNEPRTPFLNLKGIAQYVIGDYAAALKNFERNLEIKGPTGPHMDVFVAATCAQRAGIFQPPINQIVQLASSPQVHWKCLVKK